MKLVLVDWRTPLRYAHATAPAARGADEKQEGGGGAAVVEAKGQRRGRPPGLVRLRRGERCAPLVPPLQRRPLGHHGVPQHRDVGGATVVGMLT